MAEGLRRPVVVGGSGQLGRFLVPKLAQAPGCESVLVLDLRPPPRDVLERAGPGKVEFVRHWLGKDNIEDIAGAIKGADCIFSILTPPLQTATESDFYSTNVHGLQRLLEVCARAGVPRFVHLSSAALTNFEIPKSEFGEDSPLPPLSTYRSLYDLTKRLGEEAVLAADDERSMRTCVLRPCGICLSPHDNMLGNMLGAALPGVMFVPRHCKPVDMIDANDLCQAMLLAGRALAERPAVVGGQAFFLTKGETLSAREFVEMTAEMLGWRVILIPDFVHNLVLATCHLAHHVQKALGCQLLGCPMHVFWSYHMYEQTFDNSKARQHLHFKSECSIRTSVARVLAEYKQEGGVERKKAQVMRACAALGCAVSVLTCLSWVSSRRSSTIVTLTR